ncbi:TonB-dependent hemoglobin/transferrin/lactoferrin family receptor [Methylomarinovum caldicuralii]|nr:TonB-dependent hemoglobin/transferrin/lactoferrin family receptor [Methylomarinovum caldicuralii]
MKPIHQKSAAAAILLGLSWPARAETPANVIQLEGMVVTASRGAYDVLDLPESATVLDGEAIQREQAGDLGDLLLELPNVDIAGGPRNVGQRTVIRGIGDERVLYLLDGARQNFVRGHNSRMFIDPDLLKRVEVVRGPVSALWGSGAIGGVVSLQTKDAVDLVAPGQRFGAKVKGGFQSVSDQGLGSAAVYGLLGERFDYLFHFAFRGSEDIQLGRGRLEHSGFDAYSGLAKFRFSPHPDHSLSFSAQSLGQNQQVPFNPQSRDGSGNPLVDRETQQHNFIFNYRFQPQHPWLDLNMTAYHNQVFIREKTRRANRRRDETDFTTTGVNLLNRSDLGQWGAVSQRLTYGIDYYHDQGKADRNGEPRSSFPDAESDVAGIYLQDEMRIFDPLTLFGGVRWDYYQRQSQRGDLERSAGEVTFRAGALWWLTDWLGLSLAYNEAFRSPDLNELFVSGTHFTCGPGCANRFLPNPNLDPEKAHNKEVGLRIKKNGLWFADDRLRIRASFFRNQVDDFIDTIVVFSPRPMPPLNPGPGGFTTHRNVRDAELEGFEAELNYQQRYAWLGFAYSQTRGRDKTEHRPLANVAPDEWVIQAGLRHPELGLSLGWRTRIVEDQDRVPAGIEDTPGFTVHDLRLSWQPRHKALAGLRADFAIDNLGDRDYREHLSLLKSPGRNFKINLSYRF